MISFSKSYMLSWCCISYILWCELSCTLPLLLLECSHRTVQNHCVLRTHNGM